MEYNDLSPSRTTSNLVVGSAPAIGEISLAGEQDEFVVQLVAGQSYQFSLEVPGGLLDPYLELYNADDVLLAADDDGGAYGLDSLLTFTASTSGTYYLWASDYQLENVGDYTLSATLGDQPASISTGSSLAVDSSVAGLIGAVGDIDWFRVVLTAGIAYTFEQKGAPSNLGTLPDPSILGLFDASGNAIGGTANDDFGASYESRVVFTPSASGTYYVAAAAFDTWTGSYMLSLSGGAAALDLPASTATSASVALGGTLRSVVDPAGDVDWVRAELVGGQTYAIELNADGSVFNPLADPLFAGVHNSAGVLIAGTTNDDYGIGLNSRVTFTAASSGSYYLAASGYGETTGAYALSLLSIGATMDDAGANVAGAVSLVLGTPLGGAIDFARDVDWFKVELTSGQDYIVKARGAASGAGTLADPELVAVYDSSGSIIAGTGNNDSQGSLDAQSLFRPASSGFYYVAVDAANDGTGSYTVSVESSASQSSDIPGNATSTTQLPVGQSLSSDIGAPGDIDWLRVTLDLGTSYRFDLRGASSSNGSLLDPVILGLFDASGQALPGSSDDDSGAGLDASITLIPQQSGDYFVAVGGYGAGTGSYQLALAASGADLVAPTLLATAPVDGALAVLPGSNLTLEFSEAVRAGSGNISISNGAGDVRSIAITDNQQVSFSGSTMTIDPLADLVANSSYTVTFGAGVVRDFAGNGFAGITSSQQFNFATSAAAAADSWTVMVYMAADNNLESFALDDLNEMESVILPASVNVVALVDRAPGYSSAASDWTDTRSSSISHDNNLSTLGSTFTSIGEQNTGSGATLTSFINGALASHPANHYALIIWDHGGGLAGTSWDDSSGGDNLTLPEMLAAVDASNVPRFDLIGFDACLQGMLEQAWDLRSQADVVVASQELEPGDGWEYQLFLGRLVDNPNLTSFDLADAMVDAYAQRYAGQSGTTLSATRSAALPALKNALDAFTSAAIAAGPGAIAPLRSAIERTTAINSISSDYRDLGDFMHEVGASGLDAAVLSAAAAVTKALGDAVLSRTGTVAGANGLSVYLPLQAIDDSYLTQSFSFLQGSSWGNLLRFLLADQGADNLLGDASNNDIRGFAGNDTISSGLGNDTLDGGTGNDSMTGGDGADTYYVDSVLDVVVEPNAAAAGGIDTVVSSLASYTLGANIEWGRIDAPGAASISGNTLNNTLFAGGGNNTIDGAAGVDTVSYLYATAGVSVALATGAQATVGSGTDSFISIEHLTGSAFGDHLTGSGAANNLDGGQGNDTLTGGDSSDTYFIRNAGDLAVEAIGTAAGIGDLALVYYGGHTLAANVENGRLMPTVAAIINGNALNNILYAGAGNNQLNGGLGLDTASYLFASSAINASLAIVGAQATGGSGSDSFVSIENLTGSKFADNLTGNAAANILDGGLGLDVMAGGDGNDIYFLREAGDSASESNAGASGGIDQVLSYLGAYTLGANVETGRVMLTSAANLSGNELGNTLYAGAGNNQIDGGLGIDTLSYQYAGAGVSISLATAGAQATGGSGSDSIVNIERLTGSNYGDTLTGDAAINLLSGGAGNDTLDAGAGNDLLIGGLGKDSLTGGLGADRFDYNAVNESGIGNTTWDVIADFQPAQGDKIDLSSIDADTTTAGDQAFSAPVNSGTAFSASATFTTAGQLYFDQSADVLYGNTDADAAAEFAVELVGLAALTGADIMA